MDHLAPVSGPAGGRGGFTLSELMVVVAISSFVLATALSALTTMTRELKRLEGTTLAADEVSRLGDYLATEMIGLGGGLVRPWSALVVEDSWGAAGSDRLTFAVAEDLTAQCLVSSVAGSKVTLLDTGSGCCVGASLVGAQALMVAGTPTSDPWRKMRRVSAVDVGACAVTLSITPTALDQLPSTDSAWAGGILARVRARQVWLDEATRQLMVDEDRDGDGVWESRIAADRVFDLQVALGYDVPRWDWQVTDLGSNLDEWRFNAGGDTFAVNDGQGLAKARASDLRLIRLGLIVGAPDASGMAAPSIRLLNGPARSQAGWLLRAHLGTTGLRNYDIMR